MENDQNQTQIDPFKEAMSRRIGYDFVDDGTPLGGLNPHNGYYSETGLVLFQKIRDLLQINKSDRVLEVGCGTGRVSTPFAKYIGKNFSGFDVNTKFIDYCHNIGGNFSHIDIFHPDWNPNGKVSPDEVVLPFSFNKFTAIYAVGVFNHLHFRWFQRYIEEFARILPRGGRIFFTLVVAKEPIGRETPPFFFEHRDDIEWYDYRDKPLYNIAFSEQKIRKLLINNRFMISEPIKFGSWNRSPIAITNYDVIVAHKR